MPLPSELPEIGADVSKLSFRQAQAKYHISFRTWRAIKAGADPRSCCARSIARTPAATVSTVIDSVRTSPHLNTTARARTLGLRVEVAQRVLKAAGLSKLPARLQFAGYQVEANPALAAARQRRVVATAPGCYTCIDFKYFGLLPPIPGRQRPTSERRICGLVVIDQFSGYGSVFICAKEDEQAASLGFVHYVKHAPFQISGLVLSDNGAPFIGRMFENTLFKLGLQHKTTHYAHPWSNGKVERFNGVLQTSCFPAIVCGTFRTHEEVQTAVDVWLKFYNNDRASFGRMNRGLPPLALVSLWNKTPGAGVIEKLSALGVIRMSELPYLRAMGSAQMSYKKPDGTEGKAPYAFVVDKSGVIAKEVVDARRFKPSPVKPDALRLTQ